MADLTFFIVLTLLSIVNGLIAYRSEKQGRKAGFSWWVSGFTAMGAIHSLLKAFISLYFVN